MQSVLHLEHTLASSRLVLALFLLVSVIAHLSIVTGSAAASSPIHASDMLQGTSNPSEITPWKPRPVLGPQKTLVLLVEFTDIRFGSSIREITALVDHVDKWFRKSSYGKMYIDYTIHEDILTLPDTMSSYGVPKAGNQRGDDPDRADTYIIDTLNYVITQTDADLHQYKHVVIIHAGGDEANTSNPNEIWSYCDCTGPIADEDTSQASWVLYDENRRISHVFWGVSTFSEDEPWAVFVHEYTHSLGVSDLYVYGSDGYSVGPGVGFWSNMAAGAMLDPPVDIDGWSKYILGWIQVTTVESPQGEYMIHSLDSVEEPKALLIGIEGSDYEYYFLHARRKVDADVALPSEGVVVFRINALLERSLEGDELALISDANPSTPTECDSYSARTGGLCRPLDAPYNEKGKSYAFSYYGLSADIILNNNGFWDDGARIAFRVDPTGTDAFKITLGRSPEDVGITTTTTTVTTQPGSKGCIVATAAFGSEMASEVVYMRYVRDGLIGSTHVGHRLVEAFNAFYYSWSPPLAQSIALSASLRAVFRVLLLPIVWIVHITAAVFTTTALLTGNGQAASLVAFLLAASMCLASYVIAPVVIAMKLSQVVRRSRPSK
jgi:M6 family metalloprotease-like protein